jgi:solute carrier family 25 protein 39/40
MAAQQGAEPAPLSLLHRSIAAGGASIVSALIVNPLDVVKTRIQAQGALDLNKRLAARSDTLLEKWSFAACECVRVQQPGPNVPPVCGPTCSSVYTGTWDGLRKIARREGMRVLWRGTDVALMMAIPMVGIYLPLYDYLLQQCQATPALANAGAPLLAGTLARTAAVYCTAPFELVRTRLQAAHAHAPAAAPAMAAAGAGGMRGGRAAMLLQHMPTAAAHNGSRLVAASKLWTGVGATLARDVPFSALYWGMVEPIRSALLPASTHSRTDWQVFSANVTAGALAGGLAGAITTPFDVLKTRAQLSNDRAHPLLSSLRSIAANEGLGALFRGWSARSAKAAPACAIVLSSYECIKHLYG